MSFKDIFSEFVTKAALILAEQATASGVVFPAPEPMAPAGSPEKKKKKAPAKPQDAAPPAEAAPAPADPDEILIALCEKSSQIFSEKFMRSARKKTGLERKEIRERIAKLRAEGKVRQEDTA